MSAACHSGRGASLRRGSAMATRALVRCVEWTCNGAASQRHASSSLPPMVGPLSQCQTAGGSAAVAIVSVISPEHGRPMLTEHPERTPIACTG